jgi:3-dehydroquinate dehydratase/shikimate dehydrogenase
LNKADEHRLAARLMMTNSAKICVPICVQRASDLAGAVERAAEVADIIELRLDCLEPMQLKACLSDMGALIQGTPRPLILTLRPAQQGGSRALSVKERTSFPPLGSFWFDGVFRRPEFVDLEVDLDWLWPWNSLGSSKIICSHHDFVGVPTDLDQIYERIAATPARILKIAVQADDAIDCLPIFRLLERAHREGREMIAIAMGPAGIMTRILGPSRGSFLTYGSLDDESATAPGQLTARELREVYRIDSIDQQTEIFGIIGKPVGHSLSPQMHNAAFAAGRVNAVYLPFEVGDAVQFIRRMVHTRSRELDWNLRGLSVTAPHKSVVMGHLDWIEPAAKQIGAVNTILIQEDALQGYNTDAAGFIAPLRRKFGSLRGTRCAIVGAGGGARAALWALRNEGARVSLFVRDPDKARELSEEFEVDTELVSGASFAGFDIVVNATPLGTRGVRGHETVATVDQLGGVRLAYDLVYNPLETQFLCAARAAGSETLGGLEMLVAQAVEQFKIWMGNDPDVDVMRATALRALEQPSLEFKP